MLLVGSRLVIQGTWDKTPPPDGRRQIVLNPTEAFGVGYEPTTRTFIEELEKADVANKDIADIGTGTGILALACVALGARHVYATDIHPGALADAKANIASNGSADRVDLINGTFPLVSDPLDLIISNVGRTELIAEIIDWSLPQLWKGGRLFVMPTMGDHVMIQAHVVIRGMAVTYEKAHDPFVFMSIMKG